MKFFLKTFTHVRHAMIHLWDNDPLRRRPLSNLTVQEHRLRSKMARQQWIPAAGHRD